MKRVYYRPNGVMVRAFVLDKVTFNVGMDDTLFIEPLTH